MTKSFWKLASDAYGQTGLIVYNCVPIIDTEADFDM